MGGPLPRCCAPMRMPRPPTWHPALTHPDLGVEVRRDALKYYEEAADSAYQA